MHCIQDRISVVLINIAETFRSLEPCATTLMLIFLVDKAMKIFAATPGVQDMFSPTDTKQATGRSNNLVNGLNLKNW
jgi:hypothetical protein